MAIRISSDASAPKRSANAPTQTAYTLAGWFKFASVTPARFWGPLGLYAGTDGAPTSGTSFHCIESAASGSASLVLDFIDSGAVARSVAFFTALPDTWYFIAMTCNTLASGGLRAHVRSQFSPVLTSVSNANTSNTFTAARIEWGRQAFTGEFIDGVAQHCIAFDRALDPAELTKLSYALLREKPLPDRRNLNVYYRLRGADDIQDLSGNARPATMTVGANAQGLRLWPSKFRKVVARAGGPRNIAVGLASSSHTAFALGKKKSKAVGLSTQSSSALALTRRKSKALGLATQSSSALAVAHTKKKLLGLASSANTALAVVAPHFVAVGLATSTNVALAVRRLKRKVLGLASSSHSAFSVTPTGPAPPGGGGIGGWIIDYLRRRIFFD